MEVLPEHIYLGFQVLVHYEILVELANTIALGPRARTENTH